MTFDVVVRGFNNCTYGVLFVEVGKQEEEL